MLTDKWHQKINGWISQLQKYADRVWYGPLIGLLAALDNLILVIPNDGILISSSMLIPKRWFWFSLFVAIGSTMGAFWLATLVEQQGLPWVMQTYPWLETSQTWQWTNQFFDQYGLFVVFAVAITPLAQQPAVIMAAISHTPMSELLVTIFVGRWLKFLLMAYVGSHAPKYLSKMWGLKGELKDVGIIK